jgi:hypothetical protein
MLADAVVAGCIGLGWILRVALAIKLQPTAHSLPRANT